MARLLCEAKSSASVENQLADDPSSGLCLFRGLTHFLARVEPMKPPYGATENGYNVLTRLHRSSSCSLSLIMLLLAGCGDESDDISYDEALAEHLSGSEAVAAPRVPHWVVGEASNAAVWTRSKTDKGLERLEYEVCADALARCWRVGSNYAEFDALGPVSVVAIDDAGARSLPITLDGSEEDLIVLRARGSEESGENSQGIASTSHALLAAPAMVASPVYGPFVSIPSPTNCPGDAQGRWGFCQHRSGFHVGDSLYAWDINLNWQGYGTDMDNNAQFSAVGSGRVIRAGGGNENTVVVEHTSGGAYWYSSEYLHAKTLNVRVDDLVSPLVFVGRIGNTSANPIPAHLHLRLAQKNAAGTLVSFNTAFRANTASITMPSPTTLSVGGTRVIAAVGGRTNASAAGPLPGVNLNNADAFPQTYWTSSNASIARVDGNGLVTARARGTATISVRWHGVSGSVAVTVQ